MTQRFVHGGQTRVDGGKSQRKNKIILRESEKAVFTGDFALVVSLSSARLSGRQAVCTLPTDEIDR